MSKKQLVLEILTGPLDGHLVMPKKETKLSKKGKGPLIFPWDTELGESQARFFREGDDWLIEGFKARHGTYRYASGEPERIEGKARLEARNILRTCKTLLIVLKME